MPWQLEIHHIDVLANGDATLIIARQVPPVVPGPNIRSVLIDGGLQMAGPSLHVYIAAQLGAAQLSAIICSHFDIDHTNGLSYMLRQAGRCNNAFIYDQGWEGNAGADATYVRYLNAINGRNNTGTAIGALAGVLNRTRVTSAVQSDGLPPIGVPAVGGAPAVPAGGLGAITDAPQWLLTAAAPQDPLWHGAGLAAPPAGAPTMRFIAANGFVRTAAGAIAGPFLGLGTDPRNEKSLAVEVRFGNFRYYAGGDLETPQENQVQTLLNNADNAAGRVLAFKTSHHGSVTATSAGFVEQLRPGAAFISCGSANRYDHPDLPAINILDGYPPLAAFHAPPPPPPQSRPVWQYLTGYATVGPPPVEYGGDASMTAGDPVPPVVRGDIVLRVDAAQAAAPVRGRLYVSVQAAVQAALTTPGLAGVLAAGAAGPVATVAAEEAMVNGPALTASRVITQAAGAGAAGSVAAANAANGPLAPGSPPRMMASAVTLAALNAGAAAALAAGAGAAAGTCLGGGSNLAVQEAVAGALVTAGLAGGPAAALPIGTAVAAALAPPPAQFSVRFYWRYRVGGAGNVSRTHR